MKGFVFLLILILIGVGFAYGSTVKGIVKNSDTGDPLIGANVVIKGTGMGATTDEDGFFIVQNVSEGDYKLEVSYVGYNSYTESIKVGTSEVELQISLKPTIYMGAEITVLADRALPRETPVAFSDVNKKEMQTRLGSRDIPLVLNTTPSVYATTNGGGAGDARINIRGFNQRNVAVMINGIPINDMENGWVYWSNWDGLGDATNSLQVQRGLSAVNLATPSIGGTLNIITDPTAQSPGVMFRQEVGNDGFLKETLVANSGLINDKYAVSGSFVRKVGDGLVDKTWTDAWAYYVGASWVVNKDNRLELYVMGAPQQHGQNRYKQNIAAYDSSFAKDLADYDNIAVKYFPKILLD
jgi:iron complex outermembrane receptor protein